MFAEATNSLSGITRMLDPLQQPGDRLTIFSGIILQTINSRSSKTVHSNFQDSIVCKLYVFSGLTRAFQHLP
jgi:hypothetical protein